MASALARTTAGVPRSRALRPAVIVLPWVACVLVALTVHFLAPHLVNDYWVNVLRRVGVFIVAAVSLNIVNGFTGQFSMGHAGFMALGGYIAAGVTYYGALYFHGSVHDEAFATQGAALMLVGLFMGATVAAGAGYLVGLPSLRLRGDYLAIVTLGFGEIIRVILELTGPQVNVNPATIKSLEGLVAHPGEGVVRRLIMDPTPEAVSAVAGGDASSIERITGLLASPDVQALKDFWGSPLHTLVKVPLNGPTGFFGIPPYATLFWIFLFVAATCLVAYRVKTSSSGRAFLSIREDEIAARAMGIDLTKYKVRAFVLAAFFGGIAGGLMAHTGVNPAPTDAGFQRSFEIIIMVVLGGLGSISGSVLAAIILITAPELLRSVQEYRLVVYALLLIGMMLVRPQGLFGVREIWELGRSKRPAPGPAGGGR
jgi:branched-chain amino acid transport system permease protein